MATSPNSNNNTSPTTATSSTTGNSSESRSLRSDPIAWLQSRIGSYDVAHDLEPLVQKSVLKGLKHVPKRSGRIKTELIDLDLVRGSPYPKPNTQFCWDAFSKKSLLRFLLFPLFFRWWRQHLSKTVWLFFLFLYSLFILVLLLFFADDKLYRDGGASAGSTTAENATSSVSDEPPITPSSSSSSSPSQVSPPSSPSSETFVLTELLLPFALAMALAFIHTQIVTGARSSSDYRHSSAPECVVNAASFGSPFLSSHDGVRRHRTSVCHGGGGSANNSNCGGKRCGSSVDLTTSRKLTPIHDIYRGYEGGGATTLEDTGADLGDDVAALLSRCEVASLTQMDDAGVGDDDNPLNCRGESLRIKSDERILNDATVSDDPSRLNDPFPEGLRQRRPLPDDSGVEDSGATTRPFLPESENSSSTAATKSTTTLRTEVELVGPYDVAARGLVANGADDAEKDDAIVSRADRSEPLSSPLLNAREAAGAPTSVATASCCANVYCCGNAVACLNGDENPQPFPQPTCRDSSTSSDVGPQISGSKIHFKPTNNRDSTASVTDEETPSRAQLNHHHHHHHTRLHLSHLPHSHSFPHNQISSSGSACPHSTIVGHRRSGAPPSRLNGCSPTRRYGDVKKQLLLQKNNRPAKKSIALDAMTLSSNNSDEDSEDDALLKSSSPRRTGHPHHMHGNGVFSGRSHRTMAGAGSGGNAETTQWDSDDGVGGETDDGDSDTSHALGASSLVVPSSPYAADDDEDADPLSVDLNGDGAAPGTLRGKVDGGLGSASVAKNQTRKSPPATNAASQSSASQQGKISCRIWEGNEIKKAHLSASDVSWIILEKVENLSFSSDYLVISTLFSLASALFPLVFHIRSFMDGRVGGKGGGTGGGEAGDFSLVPDLRWVELFSPGVLSQFFEGAFGGSWKERILIVTSTLLRLLMSFLFLFLLSVAERTFKQRLLHAKFFCHLTSARRARASDLPHFRLNKVQNIKSWLSVRSFLKRRGPTRSVDIIVSVSFLVTCFLILFMCVEILKNPETFLDHLYNWEMISWGLILGVFMLRLITLGSKINKKYRNLSVLLTEQINLYLQMEQKPFKKEQFSLANNVLKLAAELLKELDTPFKISGIAANPLLYNISRVVILSAFSGVLTEMLGFKLKLWKIKMK